MVYYYWISEFCAVSSTPNRAQHFRNPQYQTLHIIRKNTMKNSIRVLPYSKLNWGMSRWMSLWIRYQVFR